MKNVKNLIVIIVQFITQLSIDVKKLKNFDKKFYLSLKKTVNDELKRKILTIDTNSCYNMDDNLVSFCFMNLFKTEVEVYMSDNKSIIYDKLIKDNEFMIFFTKLVIFEKVNFNSNLQSEFRNFYKLCFGDIRAIVMSYALIKEKNLTTQKMLNFLSFFLKGSSIDILNTNISDSKLKQIEMITTGVKFEKMIDIANNSDSVNTSNQKSKTVFDITDSMSNRIRIKYISGKNYKHTNGHKSPETHIRNGHFKCLRNGEIRWIPETIVNGGKAA
ncbi:hypothetical protein CRU98_08520 [Arcobacter sp. CECT 8986]|uniref:hypothetical protein n=1 Tax=Arcobacter sp. CECT 8986 TaxID=2044507 RepID=UPI001009BF91|nr:hypothetical protein [Arcobacter sp. CECT 8986]RXJ98799.1 hypothetical protein CRU98_08520 [Arcobacter sp. CECT 8986]